MRRVLTFAVTAALLGSCAPDIPNNSSPLPSSFVTAQLDLAVAPPVVPTPTDLIKNPTNGLLAVPLLPGASSAELELDAFLNTLDGFPGDTPANATFDGPLNPGTVTFSNVRVLDLTTSTAVTGQNASLIYQDVPGPSGTTGSITIVPNSPGWQTGHQYAVVVIGGSSGLKGAQGQPVLGSLIWTLISANGSLVTCSHLSDTASCHATTNLISSDAQAIQLETVRRAYKPLLDSTASQGVPRGDIVLVWIFSINSRPAATFDPNNAVIPFPSNLVTAQNQDGGMHVNLPIPDGGPALLLGLLRGLNALDGFSTSAPIISENSDTLAALTAGLLDPTSIATGTGVINLTAGPDGGRPPQPQILACLDCTSSPLPDGGRPNNPQQLQLVPIVPLNERSTYVAYFTSDLRDQNGNSVAPTGAFALLRNRNPLLDASGKSTISSLPTASAKQLETVRAALKPALDALQAATGVTRDKLVLATVFTTQSQEAALKQLRSALASVPNLSVNPVFVSPAASNNFHVAFQTASFLTGPSGVFNLASPRIETTKLEIQLPIGPMPPNGWPVIIFGHGLMRSRNDLVRLANHSNFPGQALLSTDTVWHGDRSVCTGSASFTQAPSDDFACERNPQDGGPLREMCGPTGRCVPMPNAGIAVLPCDSSHTGGQAPDAYCDNQPQFSQGRCLTNADGGMFCEGGYFARDADNTPTISGWNILNLSNLFATRDNFRQQVVDLTQLARVIQATGNGSLNMRLAPAKLDPNSIHYIGMSLGGILGTLYTSVAPEIHRVVLNVPGADLPNILLTSPAFTPQRNAFLGLLASQNPPIFPGTPAFDTVVGFAKWTLDPADPENQAFSLMNGAGLPTDRSVLLQYITTDQVIPNRQTLTLISSANRPGVPAANQLKICRFDPTVCPITDPTMWTNCPASQVPLPERHSFLINYSPPDGRDAVTSTAQIQASSYINNPSSLACPYP